MAFLLWKSGNSRRTAWLTKADYSNTNVWGAHGRGGRAHKASRFTFRKNAVVAGQQARMGKYPFDLGVRACAIAVVVELREQLVALGFTRHLRIAVTVKVVSEAKATSSRSGH